MSAVLHPGLPRLVSTLRQALNGSEEFPCDSIRAALADMIGGGNALTPHLLQPSPDGYRRELLHQEPEGRFSIGCFMWGPGQRAPIHDHRAWGVIGVTAGALRAENFTRNADGQLRPGESARLEAGATTWIHPAMGDIHRVGSDVPSVSVSIHVYGCTFDAICRTRYPE